MEHFLAFVQKMIVCQDDDDSLCWSGARSGSCITNQIWIWVSFPVGSIWSFGVQPGENFNSSSHSKKGVFSSAKVLLLH